MLEGFFSFFGDHSGIEGLTAKFKAAKLSSKFHHGDAGPLKPTSDFGAYDTNSDGIISIEDCPYDHGSVAAKLWWQNIQVPYIKATMNHPESMYYIDEYGSKFHGFYNGKPLLTGVSSNTVPGQGDFDYIVDRLIITQGLSKGSAQNIAGFVKAKLGSRV